MANSRSTPMRPRELPDLGMRGRRELAQLRHVPDHEPLSALELRQHLDPRAHGARVRVVGIVNDPGAAERLLELQPPGDRAHGAEARDDVFELRAGRRRRRGSRESVRNVMTATHMKRDGRFAERSIRA